MFLSVDGNWGPWFGWSPCSKSCDGGTRRRERRCNYPPPTHGGKVCPGRAERVQTCNEDECPGMDFVLNVHSSVIMSGFLCKLIEKKNPPYVFYYFIW